MSLLFPIMAFGSLLVGVPIYLHLRRRDEKNLVEFPTLRFLDDQPVARARPMWPQNWPLLLLRILCMLLLVTAFSWPYFDDQQTLIIKESRVYILDNTLSVQARNQFEAMQAQLVDEIDSADQGVQIGVIELGSTARVIARLGDDKAEKVQAVKKLSAGAERGDFVDAFRTAAEMLSNSLGASRQIHLLSDNQANQWLLDANSPPFLKDIEVKVLPSPPTGIVNFALSSPIAARITKNGESWVEVGVTVSLQGNGRASEIVFLDRGREMDRLPIEPASSQATTDEKGKVATDTTITYGTVFAQWKADPSQWTVGEITIDADDDDLAGDNRVFFSLPPIRKGKIEVVADSVFLRRAMSPEVMSERWETSIVDDSASVIRDSPSDPDVLCIESERLKSPAIRSAVRRDLSAGRGVILFVDQITPVISGFLREMGIEAEESQTQQVNPAPFRYVYAAHPIFAPFQNLEYGNLSEVEFQNYRRLKVNDATPLAFSAAGDPLVFESNAGPGRLIIFGFSFDRADTNWPIHPTFIPFLDQTLRYVRGETKTETFFQPGESVVWKLPAGSQAETVVVSPLDPVSLGVAEGINPMVVDVEDRKAIFPVNSQSGHYSLRYDMANAIGAVLDVNPSPLESELVFDAESNALESWLRQPSPSEDASQKTDDDSGKGTADISLSKMEALQQLNWWYILTAATIFLMAETVWGIQHQK